MDEDRIDVDIEAIQALESDGPLDELFRALSDRHVRYAVRYLHDRPTATLDRLADAVTALEAAATGAVATPSDREQVRLELYHVALPKLDALGYVDFDADDCTVAGSDIPPAVRSLAEIED